MKKPKVVLKCVKFHQGHEGDGVNADVWIDGVKCLHVLDDGNGGCLDIDILTYGSKDPERIKNLVNDLNKFVDSIPLEPMSFGDGNIKDDQGKDKLFKTSLEDYINDLLIKHQKAKELKKMEKLMQKAILFGVPNANEYSYISYKKPLSEIPIQLLQKSLDKITMMHCTGNAVILNTNLKELGLTI